MTSHTDIQVEPILPKFLADEGLTCFQPTANPVGYSIVGDTMQILTIPLQPGQKIQAEQGAMCYASNGMKAKAKWGGVMGSISGESLFKVHWKNDSNEAGFIGLTPNVPATIIPINLDEHHGAIQCNRDAFMAAFDTETKITIGTLNSNSVAACCCSGMGMFMQKVQGKNMCFLQAYGTIMQKTLSDGEEIVVDTHSVVAVGTNVTVDVVRSGGCLTCCCAGESMFNTTLKGPGFVILSSMPIEKLRAQMRSTQARSEQSGGDADGMSG